MPGQLRKFCIKTKIPFCPLLLMQSLHNCPGKLSIFMASKVINFNFYGTKSLWKNYRDYRDFQQYSLFLQLKISCGCTFCLVDTIPEQQYVVVAKTFWIIFSGYNTRLTVSWRDKHFIWSDFRIMLGRYTTRLTLIWGRESLYLIRFVEKVICLVCRVYF